MAAHLANLRFNWHGFHFESAIKGLLNGYNSANLGLKNQVNLAYSDIDGYDTRRRQDQLEPFEVDEIEESGRVILPYRDVLLYRVDDLESQAHDLRIAYSLMLYHQWERSARSWTERSDGKYESLKADVEALGLKIDPQLEDLRLLVNVIKHNNDRWGRKLAAQRPDLFADEAVAADSSSSDWFSGVELSHQELINFFDVVKRSGPDATSDSWGDDSPF